jgi:flagellar hook-associated protein 2
MAGIQANTGLATGIDIQGTVDKLMAVASKPRDTAQARLADVKAQQTALSDLMASLIAVQLAGKSLSKTSSFAQSTITSANTALLNASAVPGGSPVPGIYQFTPVRLAQAQHVLSQGFASADAALGAGTLTLRDGGSLSQAVSLCARNGGEGVQRGKIRITDRSGATAVIDLRYAQTIDDVRQAINSNETINVAASTVGDRLQLTDNTGQSLSNLRVQEVSGGSTAAGLGLASIDAAASSALGGDVLELYDGSSLSALNDGNGVNFNAALADLQVTFRDGSSPLDIDFKRLAQAASQSTGTTDAASGVDGDLKFSAVQTGAAYDGVTVQFVDNGGVTQGNETVAYDSNAKTLTFDIDAGTTTAGDVIAALQNNPTVAALFTAQPGTGGDGSGLVSLADTTTTSGGAAVAAGAETTLGDVLDTINAAAPTRLKAQLSASGDRIELTDLTAGAGTFSVASLHGGSTAEDLGIAGSTTSSTISSRRLQAGLSTTLLHSLKGGQGLGTLGDLSITDRSGASATVDLSAAQTVDDVLAAINGAGLEVRAELNDSRNGIRIVDTSDATASNLIIANGDATDTATKLGLAVNAAVDEQQSGDLSRQIVSRQTLLSSFNHGAGVNLGSIQITDSNGASSGLNLNTLGAKTLGDVIDAVNNLSIGVEARLNDTGDGLLLVDTAGGAGKLKVADVGSGTSAADLKIAGEATGTSLDGSATVKITLDADDTLSDLITKINDADVGLSATSFDDGSASPIHLSLLNQQTGKASAWVIDGTGLGLQLSEVSAAQDAVVAVGQGSGAGSLVVSSATNVIDNAVPGVRVTLSGTSTDPVSVTVKQDVASITAKVKAFVDQYNKLQDKLEKYDSYDVDTDTRSTLFGSTETRRAKNDLARLLSGRFSGSDIRSLGTLGLGFDDSGKLQFDESKFNAAYADDPDGVETFFTDGTTGFGKQLDDVVDSLAAAGNSVFINGTQTMQAKAEDLATRVDTLNARLEIQKQRLLNQFYTLETTVSKLQNSFSSISSSLDNAIALSKSISSGK